MTRTEVWQMKQLKQSGLTYPDVGKVFGVSVAIVRKEFRAKELRELVKRARGRCERCGENNKRLCVHHLNYVRVKVLILCCKCHRKIHSHPEFAVHREFMDMMTDLARVECGTVVGGESRDQIGHLVYTNRSG